MEGTSANPDGAAHATADLADGKYSGDGEDGEDGWGGRPGVVVTRAEVERELDVEWASAQQRKLLKAVTEFDSSLRANGAWIPIR